MADVFSSETGAAGAPSRPLPQAEATVSTENTSPLARSLKKAGVGEPEHIRQGKCGREKAREWENRSTYDKAGVRERNRVVANMQ